jgi:predicted transcriptional regulator
MERSGDIYFSRDFPVLAAIARWEEQGRAQRSIDAETIAKETGLERAQVAQSLGRLCHAGFLDCVDMSTYGGENYLVNRLTASGLQETGLWPKAGDLSTAIAEVLQREIQATSRSDPDRSRKLQTVLDTVTDLGASFAAKFAAELLKVLTGPH